MPCKKSKEFINFSLKPKSSKIKNPSETNLIKTMEQVWGRKVQNELFHIFLVLQILQNVLSGIFNKNLIVYQEIQVA